MQNSTVDTIYNAGKGIFCDTKFQKFLGGDTPNPLTGGVGPEPTPGRPPALRASGRPTAAAAADCWTQHPPTNNSLDPPLILPLGSWL